MSLSRIPFAVAVLLASSLAIAQATAPAAPAVPPAAPGVAPVAPPPASSNTQRAPGKAAATPGASATPAAGGTTGKTPKSGKGEPKGQLQSLYAGVMTDEEKSAYRKKVREVKTFDQCKALLDETDKAMAPRAKAQGVTIAQSPTEACDKAKARGRVKG